MRTPSPHLTRVPTSTVIEARDLRRVHRSGEARVKALDGVSLTVPRGQFPAVNCLAGLDWPTSGHVLIAGQDLAGMSDKELTAVPRDRLGLTFQSFTLLPTVTAEENVLLPLRPAEVVEEARRLLAALEREEVTPGARQQLVRVLGELVVNMSTYAAPATEPSRLVAAGWTDGGAALRTGGRG